MEKLVKTLNKNIRKYKLIDIHLNLIREGKYFIARDLLRFIVERNITLGLSDTDWELEKILNEVGCKLSYGRGRGYICKGYL